jgi:hypothetical protein
MYERRTDLCNGIEYAQTSSVFLYILRFEGVWHIIIHECTYSAGTNINNPSTEEENSKNLWLASWEVLE